jgi:hypothetical protein
MGYLDDELDRRAQDLFRQIMEVRHRQARPVNNTLPSQQTQPGYAEAARNSDNNVSVDQSCDQLPVHDRELPLPPPAPDNAQLIEVMVRALSIIKAQRRGDNRTAPIPLTYTLTNTPLSPGMSFYNTYTPVTPIPLLMFTGIKDFIALYDYLQEFERFARAQPGTKIDMILCQYVPFSLRGVALRW